MLKLLYIALGGAIGSLARYQTGVLVARHAPAVGSLNLGTLAVNIVGSFLIGLCVHAVPRGHDLQFLIVTGFLGGFTTFSAFSVDTLYLLRAGQGVQACAYVLLSVILSLLAVSAGAQMRWR